MEKCPCCGKLTLDERGQSEICPVCGWEDDSWDSANPDEIGLCNWVTLTEARKLFSETGKNILEIWKERHKE